MNKRPLALALLFFLQWAMIAAPLAQDKEEACSSREAVYPIVKTAILDDPSIYGVRVRHATTWERLDIIGSKRSGPWCWLQVADGWLIDSARSLSSEPYASDLGQARYASRCYAGAKAYVSGVMNIRSGASTRSPVVAKARAGDAFVVLGSMAGTDWCWLKVNRGWLANTARVSSTVLPIAGSREFVRQVESALNWLELEAPEWHNYVIGGVEKISEIANTGGGRCGAIAYPAQRGIGIESCMVNWAQQRGISASPRLDQLELAIYIAHEACHIHRHEAGFKYNAATRAREEEECMKPMLGVKVSLDPYKRYGTVSNELGESAQSLVERYCSEGIEDPELYCPIIERLQGG